MRGDWKHEAEQYRELDQAVMAQIEGDDAILYHAMRGVWPDGLSVRAWDYIKSVSPTLAAKVQP